MVSRILSDLKVKKLNSIVIWDLGYEQYNKLWKANDKDPILRLETYFMKHNKLSGDDIKKIYKEIQVEVDDAVKFAIESPEPDITSATEHMIER